MIVTITIAVIITVVWLLLSFSLLALLFLLITNYQSYSIGNNYYYYSTSIITIITIYVNTLISNDYDLLPISGYDLLLLLLQ